MLDHWVYFSSSTAHVLGRDLARQGHSMGLGVVHTEIYLHIMSDIYDELHEPIFERNSASEPILQVTMDLVCLD